MGAVHFLVGVVVVAVTYLVIWAVMFLYWKAHRNDYEFIVMQYTDGFGLSYKEQVFPFPENMRVIRLVVMRKGGDFVWNNGMKRHRKEILFTGEIFKEEVFRNAIGGSSNEVDRWLEKARQ